MLYVLPKKHYLMRRGVHPSQKQHHIQPISSPLHLVCVISNPERYYALYKNYQAFEKHMVESGVILYTVELAYRDRHFEITKSDDDFHIQIRSSSELWSKENLINIGVSHFAEDYEYGAYLDADFLMTRSDWVTETIHQLQHYKFVQLFSTYSNLTPNYAIGSTQSGFVKVLKTTGVPKTIDDVSDYDYGQWGSPGGGWAWRRSAFDTVGGMLDICILGSADWHMAVALAQIPNPHEDLSIGVQPYIDAISRWTVRAKAIQKNIGYIENHAIHSFHGKKINRGYSTRTNILRKHHYDPYNDVRYDWQGVLGFTGNKPDLEEDVRQYFRARDEDVIK